MKLNIIKELVGDNIIVPLRIKREFSKNVLMKKLLKENKIFKDIYKDRRCFILGNGPSLKQIDFELLQNEFTFTVNQLSRNENFYKLKTNFHIWVDENFFNINEENLEDLELLQVQKNVNSIGNKPIVFYKYSAYDMIQKFNLEKELNIYYFSDIWYDKRQSIIGHKLDCTYPMPVFPSVTCYAICLAVYMGFSEIYLLGCDCTGFLTIGEAKLNKAEQAHYAYKISENEKKRMEQVFSNKNIRDELWWYVDLFDSYKIMADYCEENNVRLINATSGSLLETIPKENFLDIIG